MPRIPRRLQWSAAACYHLLNRGHNRDALFTHEDDFLYFLRLLARYRQPFGLRLYHYCLMINHFHLLLQLADPRRLSAFMAGLLRAYVHYFNRRHGFVGHLFQGRFKSPAIEAERYLLSCGRYLETSNPLSVGMVEQPWQYRWSSCRAYALGEADPLLADNPWYEALAKEASERPRRWQDFLIGRDPQEEEIRQSDWVVGEAGFRRRTNEVSGRPGPRRGWPGAELVVERNISPQSHVLEELS